MLPNLTDASSLLIAASAVRFVQPETTGVTSSWAVHTTVRVML